MVNLAVLTVQLLQKVVQVALKPRSCVIRLFRGDVNPSLRFHVLLALTVLVHGELIQLIRLDDLRDKLSFLLDLIGDGEILELVNDLED